MENNSALRWFSNRRLTSKAVRNSRKDGQWVLLTNFPDIKLQQPESNWQVISTDGSPVSVLPIAVGQQVFCSDGHPGRVTHLLPRIDGRIAAFVFQTRGWWRRKVVIPINYIEHIAEEIVYLSVSKANLKKLPTYRPDNLLVAAITQALWEDSIFRRTEYGYIHVNVKRLLHSFYDLPPKDKQMLYRAIEHLRWLTILWDLEKVSPDSSPSIPEKRHILLAYELLQILWFSKLPEGDHQSFTVYVRDRLPDDQDPQLVNGIFDTNSDELAARCKSLAPPIWLTNEVKAIKISLESFPYKVS